MARTRTIFDRSTGAARFRVEKDEQAAAAVLHAAKRGLTKAANHLRGAAQDKVPVDTGRLKSSITVDDSDLDTRLELFVGTNVEYAVFQHEGTGIFYEGPNGERGRQEPWVYFSDRLQRFVRTSGNKPTKFLEGPYLLNLERYKKTVRDEVKGATR